MRPSPSIWWEPDFHTYKIDHHTFLYTTPQGEAAIQGATVVQYIRVQTLTILISLTGPWLAASGAYSMLCYHIHLHRASPSSASHPAL